MMQKFLCVILLTLFPTSFFLAEEQAAELTRGRKYISKSSLRFSINIPALLAGIESQEKVAEPDESEVVMRGAMGHLFCVQVCRVAHFDMSEEKYMEGFFDLFKNVTLPQLIESVPSVRIICEEKLKLDNQRSALFALVDFPKGSMLIESESGSVFDTQRGFLFFLQKDNLVMLTYQDDLLFLPNTLLSINTTDEEKVAQYRCELLKAANSYQILPAPEAL